MINKFELPFFTSTVWIFGVFLIALLLFHWVLVYQLKLTKKNWKQADYFVIGLAVTGLLGIAQNSRATYASLLLNPAESRLAVESTLIQFSVNSSLSKINGACGKFTYNEFELSKEDFKEEYNKIQKELIYNGFFLSKEQLDKTQKEFDEICHWFKKIKIQLFKNLEKNTYPIKFEEYNPPKPNNEFLTNLIKELKRTINNYNLVINSRNKLKESVEKSSLQIIWEIISPSFIATALALRIAKTTGEINLESVKNQKT